MMGVSRSGTAGKLTAGKDFNTILFVGLLPPLGGQGNTLQSLRSLIISPLIGLVCDPLLPPGT